MCSITFYLTVAICFFWGGGALLCRKSNGQVNFLHCKNKIFLFNSLIDHPVHWHIFLGASQVNSSIKQLLNMELNPKYLIILLDLALKSILNLEQTALISQDKWQQPGVTISAIFELNVEFLWLLYNMKYSSPFARGFSLSLCLPV